MDVTASPAPIFLLLLLLLPSMAVSAAADEHYGFVQRVRPAPIMRKQKLSHLRFYWHDIVGGENPTSMPIARSAVTNTSKTAFGMMRIMDNPLTLGPETSSRLVGRAQGLYASAAQEQLDLLMAMNLAFVEGKYNGSSVTVLGRNAVFSEVREMPVIGGSGLFRFATGYCQARTHSLDLNTLDATVEYNVYVFHY